MATIFTVTATGTCWKQHTCVGCGAVFRYPLTRSGIGQSGLTDEARVRAQAALHRNLTNGIDAHPCPHCGLVQPDMLARGQFAWHLGLFAVGFLLVGIIALAVSARGVGFHEVGPVLCGAVALLTLIHAGLSLRNPNRNLMANLDRSQQELLAGKVQLLQRGAVVARGYATGFPFVKLAAFLLGAGGAAAFLFPQTAWRPDLLPLNGKDVEPPLVSPGDEVKLSLADKGPATPGGFWAGQPVIRVLNAGQAGTPTTLQGTGQAPGWGNTIVEKKMDTNIEIRVRLPADARLAGKTLRLQVAMDITYPTPAANKSFTVTKGHVTKEFQIALAEPAAAANYRTVGRNAMGLGLTGFTLAGITWMGLARWIARGARPALTYPINPAEEPAPPGNNLGPIRP